MRTFRALSRLAPIRRVAVAVCAMLAFGLIAPPRTHEGQPRDDRVSLPEAIGPLPTARSETEARNPDDVRKRGTGVASAPSAGLPEGTFVASPTAGPTGDGSLARPMTLLAALSATSPVRPGGTILLRGGTYRGTYVSLISGTSEAPIVVRSYPGEWAVIDSESHRGHNLAVLGADTWFRDLEVMRSDPDRTSDQAGNWSTDVSRGRSVGIWVKGVRTKLINLVVHDNGDGIGLWRPAIGAEVYGCLIYNNGWKGSDRGWGHGIYVQNEFGTKTISDSVTHNNFGFGIHGYDRLGHVRGIMTDGVTSFENGSPSGREANLLMSTVEMPSDDIVVKDSTFYHRRGADGYNVRLGHPKTPAQAPNGSVTFTGNQVSGGTHTITVSDWRSFDIARNTLYARRHDGSGTTLLMEVTGLGAPASQPRTASVLSNENAYFDQNLAYGSSEPRSFVHQRGYAKAERVAFDDWQRASGLDAASTYGPAPSGTKVTIRPNRYDRGRAIIDVINWDRRTSVKLDLGRAGLKKGQRYEIRDTQNFFAKPLKQGSYRGGPISIPLDAGTYAAPIGWRGPMSHTPIEFNSFIVLPVL